MTDTKAPHLQSPDRRLAMVGMPRVFLAGGITGCPDWQATAADHLTTAGIQVYNPRQASWDMDSGESEAIQQIEWEHERLRDATVVMFWFPASPGPQPIALFELGYALGWGQPIVIGADAAYPRRLDVITQVRLATTVPCSPGQITVASTLYDTCLAAESLVRALTDDVVTR